MMRRALYRHDRSMVGGGVGGGRDFKCRHLFDHAEPLKNKPLNRDILAIYTLMPYFLNHSSQTNEIDIHGWD